MEILNKKKTASEAVAEMLSMLRKGILTPIRNENDVIIGFNVPGNGTGIQCAKMVGHHMTVGATEEEREADEKALREFIEDWSQNDIYTIFKLAVMMNDPDITAEQMAYARKIMDHLDGKDVEKSTAPRNSYANLAEDLDMLDDEELRKLMNKARREDKRDLYNASRRIMRHRGYSC